MSRIDKKIIRIAYVVLLNLCTIYICALKQPYTDSTQSLPTSSLQELNNSLIKNKEALGILQDALTTLAIDIEVKTARTILEQIRAQGKKNSLKKDIPQQKSPAETAKSERTALQQENKSALPLVILISKVRQKIYNQEQLLTLLTNLTSDMQLSPEALSNTTTMIIELSNNHNNATQIQASLNKCPEELKQWLIDNMNIQKLSISLNGFINDNLKKSDNDTDDDSDDNESNHSTSTDINTKIPTPNDSTVPNFVTLAASSQSTVFQELCTYYVQEFKATNPKTPTELEKFAADFLKTLKNAFTTDNLFIRDATHQPLYNAIISLYPLAMCRTAEATISAELNSKKTNLQTNYLYKLFSDTYHQQVSTDEIKQLVKEIEQEQIGKTNRVEKIIDITIDNIKNQIQSKGNKYNLSTKEILDNIKKISSYLVVPENDTNNFFNYNTELNDKISQITDNKITSLADNMKKKLAGNNTTLIKEQLKIEIPKLIDAYLNDFVTKVKIEWFKEHQTKLCSKIQIFLLQKGQNNLPSSITNLKKSLQQLGIPATNLTKLFGKQNTSNPHSPEQSTSQPNSSQQNTKTVNNPTSTKPNSSTTESESTTPPTETVLEHLKNLTSLDKLTLWNIGIESTQLDEAFSYINMAKDPQTTKILLQSKRKSLTKKTNDILAQPWSSITPTKKTQTELNTELTKDNEDWD